MLTTSYQNKDNVMTMAWHTMLEFTPPLIGCVISNRNFSFKQLVRSKECVIAIPSVELAGTAVKVGNVTGKNLDKFTKYRLTRIPASKVKAPLIAECFANLECRIHDSVLVGKYNFFILEAVAAWLDAGRKNPKTVHHRGEGEFTVSGETIKFPWHLK